MPLLPPCTRCGRRDHRTYLCYLQPTREESPLSIEDRDKAIEQFVAGKLSKTACWSAVLRVNHQFRYGSFTGPDYKKNWQLCNVVRWRSKVEEVRRQLILLKLQGKI